MTGRSRQGYRRRRHRPIGEDGIGGVLVEEEEPRGGITDEGSDDKELPMVRGKKRWLGGRIDRWSMGAWAGDSAVEGDRGCHGRRYG